MSVLTPLRGKNKTEHTGSMTGDVNKYDIQSHRQILKSIRDDSPEPHILI